MLGRFYAGDIAALIDRDAVDGAEQVPHTEACSGMPREQAGEACGIEVISVVDGAVVLGVRHELRCTSRIAQTTLDRHRVDVGAGARRTEQPARGGVRLAVRDGIERVVIRVRRELLGRPHPVHEADALLEGCAALAQEFRFADAEMLERGAHGRHRAFADADRRDVRGFEQRDLGAARRGTQLARQVVRRKPAGGTPADDEDALQASAWSPAVAASRRTWFSETRCA